MKNFEESNNLMEEAKVDAEDKDSGSDNEQNQNSKSSFSYVLEKILLASLQIYIKVNREIL